MKLKMRNDLLKASSLLLAVMFPAQAMAQQVTTPTIVAPNITPGTILPTDTLPLPAVQNRMSFAENFQLRILQKLPARFYFNATDETSFRDETNPFQFPKKESFMRGFVPAPATFRTLPIEQQDQIYDQIGEVARNDMIFRTLPNVTGGWTLTSRTRLYGNYFMIRDALMHEMRLNTVIHSIGAGIQQDIPAGPRGNVQLDFQFRELYQLHQQSVFDFLPGATYTYYASPRAVLFVNSLFQLRGKDVFQSPNKEMDPFYTWGGLYQLNGWSFSASTTFVQNFRQPFTSQSTLPVNNYSFISDYEISRRVIKQLPSLQAFARAEPIWNFHGKDKPGLSGMDFRIFCGLRMSMAKPALTSALEQLKQQLEEQENEPPGPNTKPQETKPSAHNLTPDELSLDEQQPIHGYFDGTTGEEGPALTMVDFQDAHDQALYGPLNGTVTSGQIDKAISTFPQGVPTKIGTNIPEAQPAIQSGQDALSSSQAASLH